MSCRVEKHVEDEVKEVKTLFTAIDACVPCGVGIMP